MLIKERGTLTLDATRPNYLLLNYEAFQQQDSQAFVKALVREHKIDFIVLDEVHPAKSRGQVESKRRQLINYLLAETAEVNPDMRVLAMSATLRGTAGVGLENRKITLNRKQSCAVSGVYHALGLAAFGRGKVRTVNAVPN